MNYKIIAGITLWLLSSTVMADGADDKQAFLNHLNALTEHFEQKQKSCNDKEQGACYQKVLEGFKSDYQKALKSTTLSDIESKVFFRLSAQEQEHFLQLAEKTIQDECEERKTILTKEDQVLINKIKALHWEETSLLEKLYLLLITK